MRAEAKASVRTSISHPVGRTAQAVACKTTQASATLARDSISSGIGVERYTPAFPAGIPGAIKKRLLLEKSQPEHQVETEATTSAPSLRNRVLILNRFSAFIYLRLRD